MGKFLSRRQPKLSVWVAALFKFVTKASPPPSNHEDFPVEISVETVDKTFHKLLMKEKQ